MPRELFGGYPFQIKALTPRQDCNRNLVDFCRCEQKLYMARRFFKRLQQRIKRVFGQHVNFVDDVDFVACRHGRVPHSLNNLPHIVYTGVACGIHFDNVDMPTLRDCDTRLASPTRVNSRAALPVGANAVQRLGNQSRG